MGVLLEFDLILRLALITLECRKVGEIGHVRVFFLHLIKKNIVSYSSVFYVFLVVSAFISSPVICVKMAPDVIWYAIFFMLLAAVTKVSLVLCHTFRSALAFSLCLKRVSESTLIISFGVF